jgi:hypothetical protein
MQTVTTIGLDIAKSVFQVHGIDAAGQCMSQQVADGVENREKSRAEKI